MSVVSGVIGSALGFASNLYSDQFRKAIASATGWFSAPVISVIIAAVIAGSSTMLIYRLIVRPDRGTRLP